MNESNISRDHIALEAMKILLDKTTTVKTTVLGRIEQFFTSSRDSSSYLIQELPVELAELAYEIADAMIQARENQ